MGKLRSNYQGTKFTVYDAPGTNPGAQSSSRLNPGGTAPTQTELDNFVSFKSPSGQKEGVLVLKSKVPRWEGQSWCLDFNGRRDIVASGRNFQLVAAPENGPEGLENGNVIFQFAKVREDVFLMGYQYPISAFQAFTISLSRFRCEPCPARFFLRRVVMME
ncbi:Tubby-like C-terminal [Arabidopsis suecica]|uniref:Tubby-like C-terminal n=1 Tax=Arabidopsis suecica TaxID=45249 RepID=A0A8T2BPP8_ARASU|nr:Tubby-like C-terminal [Arabidopsis suecica]